MITANTHQNHTFDVVILGGGPAGTAAGMTLLKREGLSVAVVEASDYTKPRMGESLSPGMRPLLEYLHVWEPFKQEQSLKTFGSQAAWGSDTPSTLDYMFTLHGNGWNLDRVRFDKMMATAFCEQGGHLLTKTHFLNIEETTSHDIDDSSDPTWRIHVQHQEGGIQEIRSRYVIDATGRQGRLARQLGAVRRVHDRLIGVGCIGQLPDNAAIEHTILVEACEYGWWYTSPIPGNKLSVVLISDADVIHQGHMAQPAQWHALLNDMPLSKQRVCDVRFEQPPKAFPCFSSCLQQVGGAQWVAVGDAVASHDPLSSSGISHAIGSGVHGALVAENTLFGDGQLLQEFQQGIHNNFMQYLRTHWQYYRTETRWPDSLFWQRRTTPITTAPELTIEQRSSATSAGFTKMTHLPARFAEELYLRCRVGRVVHEIVRDFSRKYPQVPDNQIILGLQELIQRGHVVCQPV